MEPTIITGLKHDSQMVHRETFAPIVYILKCKVCTSQQLASEYSVSVVQWSAGVGILGQCSPVVSVAQWSAGIGILGQCSPVVSVAQWSAGIGILSQCGPVVSWRWNTRSV